MSIAIENGSPDLEQAVLAAQIAGIVIFGSRGDSGNNQSKVYPADYNGVISISSLTNYGKPTDSTEFKANYFVVGENVKIPVETSYLEKQQRASGSSVATAIAVGVAALTHSCRRLGNPDREFNRSKLIKKAFEHMVQSNPNYPNRYLRSWKLFPDERKTDQEGEEWLKSQFGPEGFFCC